LPTCALEQKIDKKREKMIELRNENVRKRKFTLEISGPSCFRIEIEPGSAEKLVGEKSEVAICALEQKIDKEWEKMIELRNKNARKRKFTLEISGPSCFGIEIEPGSAEKLVGEKSEVAILIMSSQEWRFGKKTELERGE
jgi:translation initiation factor 1 (eIF-1/SUI1)